MNDDEPDWAERSYWLQRDEIERREQSRHVAWVWTRRVLVLVIVLAALFALNRLAVHLG